MILLVGQVGREMLDREAFQEVNHQIFFSEMSKWSAEIKDASRIPEYLSHAFHVALSGRPGPVVLSLPEDMLRDVAEVEDAPRAIPVQSAPTFVRNIDRHNRRGVILSWSNAVGGLAHVNPLPLSAVAGMFAPLGYFVDDVATRSLQNAATIGWFKDTLMVLRRSV